MGGGQVWRKCWMGNGILVKFGLENFLVFKVDLFMEKYELFFLKNFSFS